MHGACDIIFYFLLIVYLLTIVAFSLSGRVQIAIGTQVLFLSPVTGCIFTVFLLYFYCIMSSVTNSLNQIKLNQKTVKRLMNDKLKNDIQLKKTQTCKRRTNCM